MSCDYQSQQSVVWSVSQSMPYPVADCFFSVFLNSADVISTSVNAPGHDNWACSVVAVQTSPASVPLLRSLSPHADSLGACGHICLIFYWDRSYDVQTSRFLFLPRYCRGKSSVCLSEMLRYRDHIGWNTSKVMSWLILCRPQHHGSTPKGTAWNCR